MNTNFGVLQVFWAKKSWIWTFCLRSSGREPLLQEYILYWLHTAREKKDDQFCEFCDTGSKLVILPWQSEAVVVKNYLNLRDVIYE